MRNHFESSKCELALERAKSEIILLEKIIEDNTFTWECCARGGEKLESGGCNISGIDEVCYFLIQ